MSLIQILLLILYAAGMAAGQTLFKLSSLNLNKLDKSHDISPFIKFIQIAASPIFIGAIALYLILSVLWVKILSFTPLNRAYPFTALAFVFTTTIGIVMFQESLSRSTVFGITFIMIGIFFIARN